MTERIYSDEDLSAIRLQCYEAGRLGKEAYTVRGGGEAVVRCRDCKYAMERRSKSVFGTELVTLACSGPIQGAYSEGADVEPEDFCAWGEPREVE